MITGQICNKTYCAENKYLLITDDILYTNQLKYLIFNVLYKILLTIK